MLFANVLSKPPTVNEELFWSRPNFIAKNRLVSLKGCRMFSRRVVPEVSGMEASIGNESPRMPLFPVPASPSPVVSFAKAGKQEKACQFV